MCVSWEAGRGASRRSHILLLVICPETEGKESLQCLAAGQIFADAVVLSCKKSLSQCWQRLTGMEKRRN